MTLSRPLLQARPAGVGKFARALAKIARIVRPETNAPLPKPMPSLAKPASGAPSVTEEGHFPVFPV
jgi:hypothetical protein